MCRVTSIKFDRKTGELLDELRIHYGATSKAEVIRKAVALLTVAVAAEKDGAKLMVISENYKKEIIVR